MFIRPPVTSAIDGGEAAKRYPPGSELVTGGGQAN
jgi:hypothetical protein